MALSKEILFQKGVPDCFSHLQVSSFFCSIRLPTRICASWVFRDFDDRKNTVRNHYRQILPALLEVLDFHSNNTAYQPVIEALSVVRQYVSSRVAWYPTEVSPPIEGVVPSSWENIVTEKDSAGEERVNRLTYELSVLQTLWERVRSKEIWVAGAAQFRNPEDDLPRDFDQQRATYYADLNLPLSADEFIASLQTKLTTALTSFERFMAKKLND